MRARILWRWYDRSTRVAPDGTRKKRRDEGPLATLLQWRQMSRSCKTRSSEGKESVNYI